MTAKEFDQQLKEAYDIYHENVELHDMDEADEFALYIQRELNIYQQAIRELLNSALASDWSRKEK